MRDLIRNYKLIIKDKYQPDSESELFVSSTSSPESNIPMDGHQSLVFKHVQYTSTESEDDVSKETPTEKYQEKKKIKSCRQKFLSRSHSSHLNMEKHDNKLYNEHSSLTDVISETTRLLPSKRRMDESLGTDTTTKSEYEPNPSMVTIFAVWNTTMGTSLLAMAWGMEKTGLIPGIVINLLVLSLCLYTAYTLLKINEQHGVPGENFEVPDLCRILIGRWAEVVSKTFSLIILTGSDIVYWILMSNFLYNLVVFIYGSITEVESEPLAAVYCSSEVKFVNVSIPLPDTDSNFNKVWRLYSTVPIFLAFVLFPLLNIKSPTFFTKFNTLGTLSVGYLIVFVAVKAVNWGININDWTSELYIKPTFCALSGMLAMSYFIHNIIISIMRQNRHQNKNGRDLTIAFSLVFFTYIFLGVTFYVTFPANKSCIEDNLLNNFSKKDVMAVIARILLFFQLFTVFPFITFMLRNDILTCIDMVTKKPRDFKFSYMKTILINLFIVFLCILFACFLPRIGTMIRYTGALSGLIYIFVMPSLLKMASLKQEGRLSITSTTIHVSIMIIGVVNLISQFFITE